MIENFVEIKEAAVKIDTRTYRMKFKKKRTSVNKREETTN